MIRSAEEGTVFRDVRIAPSILSADFMRMASSIAQVEQAADWVHVDVMDGHFVPNLTIGVPFVEQLRDITDLPLDAHLMVGNPMREYPWFLEAGADVITMHAEAMSAEEVLVAAEEIHGAGRMIGIAIKPATPVAVLAPFIDVLDMVLVMSVEPGFSGQGYIAGSEERVAQVAALAAERAADVLIEVDGGINDATARLVTAAGADVLVCGNAFFKASDPACASARIREAATEAQRVAVDAQAR